LKKIGKSAPVDNLLPRFERLPVHLNGQAGDLRRGEKGLLRRKVGRNKMVIS